MVTPGGAGDFFPDPQRGNYRRGVVTCGLGSGRCVVEPGSRWTRWACRVSCMLYGLKASRVVVRVD